MLNFGKTIRRLRDKNNLLIRVVRKKIMNETKNHNPPASLMVGPLCDKVCQRLVTGRWCSPGPPGSPINKTDCHDITELLLKVTLSTIKLTTKQNISDLLLCNRLYNCRQFMHIIEKAESVNQKSLKMFYRRT